MKFPLFMPVAKTLSIACVTALMVSGCSDGGNNTANTTDVSVASEVRALVDQLDLTGDASLGRTLPEISDPVAQLGMKLFFSQALSGTLDTACVSCHHPMFGGGDNLSLPIGVEAVSPTLIGPGRVHSSVGAHFDGGPTVPRNAPTTFNMGMWDKTIFHDGRIESLGKEPLVNGEDGEGIRTPDTAFGVMDVNAINLTQGQARFPVTSAEEMRGSFGDGTSNDDIRAALTTRIVDQTLPNSWINEFQAAFDSTATAVELITFENIAHALGEYERSQVFVNSPWKAFVAGDDNAMTLSAQRGAKLFYTDPQAGGAGCVACHSSDFFSDEEFHVLATPQIGRGKGDGETGDDDFGRFRETGEPADKYAFRTPTLLNVAVTGPWTHAGAYNDLYAMIEHHVNPAEAIENYDFTLAALQQGIQKDNAEANTAKALAAFQALETSKLPTLELTAAEIEDLVEFMHALTDPCVLDRECMSPWIPDNTDSGPDALQLNGVDENNELL
ncbi:MAG: cytochrome-c peroxidase [Halioglobus sp.]